jgi:excisionase family DNA binding protein
MSISSLLRLRSVAQVVRFERINYHQEIERPACSSQIMTETKVFTTIEVARLCRVSDATVKRWEEAGVLRSERTSGGHRRFRAEEVARFQREQGLGLKQRHGDESINRPSARTRRNREAPGADLLHALIDGAEGAAASYLLAAHLRGEPLAGIIDGHICPAMREVGEMWHRGAISVTVEHLATRTVTSAIYKLRSTLPVPESKNRVAICCAMEGDLHELPTLLAQLTLENEGFEVINFGAATPLYSFAEEVERHTPAFVCISGAMLNDLERLARDYKDFKGKMNSLKIPVVLGGRAFDDANLRARFPAELYPRMFADVAAFAREFK